MDLFGWKRECKMLQLPSPKKFDLKNIHLLTKRHCEKGSSEVAVTDDDPKAIIPGECQIDIPEVGLFAVGIIILVGLCMMCILKMRRKKKTKPICTSFKQEDEEETFFDLEFDDEDKFLYVKTDKEEKFLDVKTDEEDESWHSSDETQCALYCRILTEEECARPPKVD